MMYVAVYHKGVVVGLAGSTEVAALAVATPALSLRAPTASVSSRTCVCFDLLLRWLVLWFVCALQLAMYGLCINTNLETLTQHLCEKQFLAVRACLGNSVRVIYHFHVVPSTCRCGTVGP